MLAIIALLFSMIDCQMLLGGPLTADVHREDIQQMAIFALGELNTLLGSQNTLVKVVSAQTQTKTCNVTIWSRPWLHDRRLTHHWCSANKRDVIRRSSVSVDIHRTDVQAMVSFALSEMNKQNKTQYKLHHIGTAFLDVSGVSATGYYLKFRVADGPNFRWCTATVWYTPSTNAKNMTGDKCYFPFKLLPTDVNSADVKLVAQFAVDQINGVDETQFKLDEVVSAKSPDPFPKRSSRYDRRKPMIGYWTYDVVSLWVLHDMEP